MKSRPIMKDGGMAQNNRRERTQPANCTRIAAAGAELVRLSAGVDREP